MSVISVLLLEEVLMSVVCAAAGYHVNACGSVTRAATRGHCDVCDHRKHLEVHSQCCSHQKRCGDSMLYASLPAIGNEASFIELSMTADS